MGPSYTGRAAAMHATGVDSRRRRSTKEQRAENGSQSAPNELRVESNKAMLWTGRVLTGLAIAFLLFDGAITFTGHSARSS
jgi:hypothetical protein